MIPNDAVVCHYCGAPQAEKIPIPGKKLQRCPRCMSFLYDEKTGCQYCGYKETNSKNSKVGSILLIFAVLVILFFICWQVGLLPFLPFNGKMVSLLASSNTEVAGTEVITEQPAGKLIKDLLSADIEATDNVSMDMNSIQEVPTVENQVPPAKPEGASAGNNGMGPGAGENNLPAPPMNDDSDFICNNQVTQFRPGMRGKIISGNASNKLRKEPTVDSDEISILTQNTTIEILNTDPVCSGGYLWRKVKIEQNGILGWTVEGDGSSYWLQPVEEN